MCIRDRLQTPAWLIGFFLLALGSVLALAWLAVRRWFRQDQQVRDCLLYTSIGIREDVGILAYAHIIALLLCEAVEHDGELFAGDGVASAEETVAVAADNALAGSPADSLGIPLICGYVGKIHRVVHNRAASHLSLIHI